MASFRLPVAGFGTLSEDGRPQLQQQQLKLQPQQPLEQDGPVSDAELAHAASSSNTDGDGEQAVTDASEGAENAVPLYQYTAA